MTDRTDDILALFDGRFPEDARRDAQADQVMGALAGGRMPTTGDLSTSSRILETVPVDRTDDILAEFDAIKGRSSPTAADQRIVNAMESHDPFREAADARILAALDGPHAVREAEALWMEHSEVNMAANAYADALVRSMPSSKTLAEAQKDAEWERNRFMDAHRNEHATEAALLEATATHLTGLAAVHRRLATERKVTLPEAWKKAPTAGTTRAPVSESASAGPVGPGPSPELKLLYSATDTYRDAIKRGTSKEAFYTANRRANEARREFMDANRSKYPTEAALREATANHLAALAMLKH